MIVAAAVLGNDVAPGTAALVGVLTFVGTLVDFNLARYRRGAAAAIENTLRMQMPSSSGDS